MQRFRGRTVRPFLVFLIRDWSSSFRRYTQLLPTARSYSLIENRCHAVLEFILLPLDLCLRTTFASSANSALMQLVPKSFSCVCIKSLPRPLRSAPSQDIPRASKKRHQPTQRLRKRFCQAMHDVREFPIEIPEEELAELRLRLRKTRWPDQIEDARWDYGTELTVLKAI